MTQHNFDRCHAICTSETVPQSPPSGRPGSAAPKPSTAVGKCTTTESKLDAIEEMVIERYGRDSLGASGLFPSIDEPDGRERTIETFIYPEGQECIGFLVVNDSCEIEGELECGPDPEHE